MSEECFTDMAEKRQSLGAQCHRNFVYLAEKPPSGVEPETAGLQNQCSAN
jgi:hypothetical protein